MLMNTLLFTRTSFLTLEDIFFFLDSYEHYIERNLHFACVSIAKP